VISASAKLVTTIAAATESRDCMPGTIFRQMPWTSAENGGGRILVAASSARKRKSDFFVAELALSSSSLPRAVV
jgi:hypothetical protein